MVKLTLDGHEVEVVAGTTILKAARSLSIEIPTFCYQDRLSMSASCRMCLVEVEGHRKLEPACATVVSQDMVVNTHSGKTVTAREDMLEILLANHPLDCPVCDKGGECELQDTVFEYGKGDSRLNDPKRVFRSRDIELNNVIIFNANRCIQCQRCVRMCEEVVGEVALGTAERGLDSEITGVGDSLSDCSHCGNCIEICPVGALMSTPYRYKARPWDMERTETTCNMCGTGCSMTIETREGELMRVKSQYETGINGELLCAKGRFGFDSIDGGDRISQPMIRKGDILTPVSWTEATQFIAENVKSVQKRGGHIQGLISPRETNETAYMFQKLFKAVFNSHSLEASCRFGGLNAETKPWLSQTLANRVNRQPLQDVLKADCLLLLGSNITDENPVSGYLIREHLRDSKTPLFIANARPCGLDDIASSSLRLMPGSEDQLLSCLMDEYTSLVDDSMNAFVGSVKPEISTAESVTLLIGTEFMRSKSAGNCLRWIEKFARELDAAGKTVFVQFLLDRPNQLGVWDMGCMPGEPLKGTADMLYVVGSDPVSNCADGDANYEAALKATCLVVQASKMNKTAEVATVVLPAPGFGEEVGTFTNNEGRVQKVLAIRQAGEGIMSAVHVFTMISTALDSYLGPSTVELIFNEIKDEMPAYKGIDDWAKGNDLGFTISNTGTELDMPALEPTAHIQSFFSLITGDNLFQSGLVTEQSSILSSLDKGPYIEMNLADEFKHETAELEVTITHNGARLTAPLKENKGFPKGLVYVPENMLAQLQGKLMSSSQYPAMVDVTISPSPE